MAETAVAEAEGKLDATPAPSTQSSSTAAEAGGSKSKPEAQERAPRETGPTEFERRIFVGLEDGLSVGEARKRAEDARPAAAADRSKGTADAERGTASEAGAPAEGQSAPEQRETVAAEKSEASGQPVFDGLDAKGRQALSQTHLLPDPKVWQRMDLATRANLLAASRELLGARSRDYQRARGNGKNGDRARDEQGRFAEQNSPEKGESGEPGSPTDAGAAARAAPAKDAPTATQGTREADASQPAGDVRGQPGARPAPVQLPLDAVKKLTEQYGEEGAAPIVEALTAMQQQFNEQMGRLNQASAQSEQAAREALHRGIVQEERTALTNLAEELPTLASDDAAWAKVKTNARVLAHAADSAGADWTWQQCLETAARSLFHSDIRQQAQRNLAKDRQTSLRATPERGNEQQRPANAVSKDEWERIAFEALDNGKTPDEIKAMRMAGAVA